MSRARILSDAEIKWAHKKWCEGYTQEDIASELNVAQSTLSISLRGRHKVKPKLAYDEKEEC